MKSLKLELTVQQIMRFSFQIVFITIILTVFSACNEKEEQTLCMGDYQTEAQAVQQLKSFAETFSNKEEWENRAAIIRQGIVEGAELKSIPEAYWDAPFNAKIIKKREMDAYTVANIAIDGMPGHYITGNIYYPDSLKEKNPIVLCPHGHGFSPDKYGRFRPNVQMLCASLARMGAVVFTYDMIGYGECTTYRHTDPKGLQIQIFNSTRVLNYLLSQDYADEENVGMTGSSGGGTQTFLLTALDDRITVSVPVVQVSAHFFGGCTCESGMPIHKSAKHETNNVEIAALAVPRPLLLISDGEDWTKNTPQVEFPYIQRIYDFYGAGEKVQNVHLADEGHDYGLSKRKATYKFMSEYLHLNYQKIVDENNEVDESFVRLFAIQDLKVFPEQSIVFLIDYQYNLSEVYTAHN